VVVESASDDPFVMEAAMFLAIIFAITITAFLCWLLFTLAVYALPLFAAVMAGTWAHATGAGFIVAGAVGVAAGAATLIIAQILFATVRSPIIRAGIAFAFALPAAFAGYHAAHGIAAIAVPTEAWRQVFASIGAVVVGGAAWIRTAAVRAAT
jgi:hypothetical protein